MGKNCLQSLLAACLLLLLSTGLKAQDNLSTSFVPPDFLNICGDPDEESVTVSVNGLSTLDRSNLEATANLFKGVQFVALNAGATSAGVTLVDASNPNRPVFSLPNLNPTGTSSVDIVFSVRANCDYTDTLAANDLLEAFDTWSYSYDIGSSTGVTETDGTIANSYRNAFAVPFITMSLPSNVGPFRVNDCTTRTIIASNSGLDGFLDTLIYENIQEAGVIVNEVLVNGNPIAVTKVPNAAGDTIITAIIEGTFFNGNTVGANPGNGDAFLDKDESVTIVENLCVISCVDGRQSTHSVSWGCDGRFCDTDTQSSLIRVGDGAANVNIAESTTTPSTNVGYCQTGERAFTISNEGVDIDAGYGAMMNLELGVVFGADVLVEGNFSITAVQIAGVNIPSPAAYNLLDNNPLFNVDPDGAGGLDDIDGDGFFDDLPIGQSIEIVGFYDFVCNDTQDTEENCTNNFNATIKARARFNDACDVETTFPYVAQSGPSNSNSSFENCSSPDAFMDVDTFYINHVQERQIRFFDRTCGGNDVLSLRVVLPTGISLLTDVTSFNFFDENNPINLLGTSMSGDTMILNYDASALPSLDGEYLLDLAFKADCSAIAGPTFLHTELEYYCPSCDCRHLWYCDDIVGPQLHATNPPCPPAVVPVCNIGVQTTSFEANRTTLGFADANYTAPVATADANTKIALIL